MKMDLASSLLDLNTCIPHQANKWKVEIFDRNLHPWRRSRPSWLQSWAFWSGGWWQLGGTFQPKPFCDWSCGYKHKYVYFQLWDLILKSSLQMLGSSVLLNCLYSVAANLPDFRAAYFQASCVAVWSCAVCCCCQPCLWSWFMYVEGAINLNGWFVKCRVYVIAC